MTPQPPTPQTLRENALRLLKAGQSALQIATLLEVPIGKIYYWRRYYMNPLASLSDGRRLYDDEFKQSVLEQIAAGVSIAELTQSLGVSRVTLFKWKRAGLQILPKAKEALEVRVPTQRQRGNEPAGKETILPQPTVADLVARIRVLEEEKEILKGALRILMGAV